MQQVLRNEWLLTAIVFLPLLGAIVTLALPKGRPAVVKMWATVIAFVTLVLCVYMYAAFAKGSAEMQFATSRPWIPSIGVSYHLGVDGLSMPLVALTGLLTFVSILYSWIINERPKEYFAFFLLLETGMMGTFCALDFVLFYVFWEISLVPMYFLIGIWGGPRREYAAIKFFLYTLVGSVAMLLAILALYFSYTGPNGKHTFDVITLITAKPLAGRAAMLAFWAFYLSFAIKMPAFPFHTWLPDAHVEAPTAGSIILAGVLLKMGTYGLVRFNLPLFPQQSQECAWILAAVGVIAIIYGSLVAMAQSDLKKLVAYSSVGHMGFVMIGIAAAAAPLVDVPGVSRELLLNAKVTALNGATLQMVNHGLITGALFLLVGVLYERAHHRNIDGFGGLMVKVPVYAAILIYVSLASLGLPGLCGFVGEFLALLGTFAIFKLAAGLSVIGIVVTAAYFLWMLQRVLLGPLNERYKDLMEINALEKWAVAPLLILIFILGVYPAPVLDPVNAAMDHLVRNLMLF
ncbi:MAG: oxidoreductase [Armatimonadetes bacterium CG2_30_59_28]|nr:NADH-quinone oxidoreductase subunit M [Armatimonadota bacterium]OIO89740.1 MAG: oxidoreductase [Armatimonadetes bacterium CG2_30_59_28]PIU66902.1 MAG: oxidoreductase [Armatimonadetes bacterium CG07_land_8_20_14_0_80_59_28]PIX37941.1 MAG: oxidoreductase [Armatimonadetes bacterium CG_4_8_14_3_um_filter_58_9]PIY49124.1 MAG: oxidoreductase [Armatimonadetes bacterium CG_4_10_14_3_um_filter_59_10]PJB72636.1 MAG: oxidoreductase [Armatimonadetes bacterium CG_4_9_14_3_um_filter_58_7]